MRALRTDLSNACLGLLACCLVAAPVARAQQPPILVGTPNYENRVFVPRPDPSLPVTGAQPGSIAIFNGSVTPPVAGPGLSLIRSGFGQPLQSYILLKPSVQVGGELTPDDPSLVGVKPDNIDPSSKVYWLASQKKLIATDGGLVTLTWGSTVRQYLISTAPAQSPMGLYWAQTSTGGVGGPAVQIPNTIGVTFLWNSSVPPNSLTLASGTLTAGSSAQGLIVLVYTNKSTGAYIGREVVDVRDSTPTASQALTTVIGTPLAPSLVVTNPGAAVFRAGLGGADPSARYVDQYLRPGDPASGLAFAYRQTTALGQINVFWTRGGLAGIVWPYEMDSYNAVWPDYATGTTMRLYLTEDQNDAATTSPPVDLTAAPFVKIHYNDEIPEATNIVGRSLNLWLQGKSLHAARQTGHVLLHYENVAGVLSNGFLGLQVVQVVPNIPDLSSNVPIGTALGASHTYDNPPLAGKATKGTQTPIGGPSFLYVHDVDGPMKGLIYPVRPFTTSDVEVFWMRKGLLGVAWPYEMANYAAAWPSNPQIYVRGDSQDALGAVVDIPKALNAELKYQEPPLVASLASGGTRFTSTGDGFILLKYAYGLPAGAQLGFRVVHSVLHNDARFNLTAKSWGIGTEIVDAYHQVSATNSLSAKPGYIHVAPRVTPLEDRYAFNIYTNTGQIFPVNTGNLEVWWMNLDSEGIQWPSLVKRYGAVWPAAPAIVIASGRGTGPLSPSTYPDPQIYFQNDPSLPGFNPNDEHAVIRPLGTDVAIFPLRSDLGTPGTSLPFVLMHYAVPGPGARRGFTVWSVAAEDAANKFSYLGLAGTRINPPYPLGTLGAPCPQTRGVAGPYWQDRNGAFWARAAGDDGAGTNVVMQWFYPALDSFYFPTGQAIRTGACVPWLDLYAQSPGTPLSVPTTVYWPDAIPVALTNRLTPAVLPQLEVGETLIDARRGLPDIGGECSVELLYQQSLARKLGASVALIDPTREMRVPLAALPGDVATENIGGQIFFKNLPPSLRVRLYYDPTALQLAFRGTNVHTISGSYLLPNVITPREKGMLIDPKFRGADVKFSSALTALAALTATNQPSGPNDPRNDSTALTAGVASGTGYVTLATGSSTNRCNPSVEVKLAILKVDCPLHEGTLKVLDPSSPFDEKLSLRYDTEFGGFSEKYAFEWRYIPDADGTQPPVPGANQAPNWLPLATIPTSGVGALDVTIEGSGMMTLSDNWIICRYRPIDLANPCGTNHWSAWSAPQLQEGWIKRVVRGINPFEQRFKDLGNPTRTVDTTLSMLAEAGRRWEGDIPLDPDKIAKYGLIEIYETVMKEGIKLSIEANPPVDFAPVDNQLMLVAGRLSDLYMLLGNEAFSDASDPTISVGASPDLAYVAAAPSIHAFMNQVPNILEEELNLLRGRDDTKAPGVAPSPVYNRLYWNFTGDFGETAYVLKHAIRDELGNNDGVINVEDAAKIYPQGHGDAWGHYLTATKYFYRLLRNPSFTWTPRSEATLVGDQPVTVNYVNERKFARAAAAKAKAGAEIVNLTYREYYDEDPGNQWRGYKDALKTPRSAKIATLEARAWGLSEWGMRAGQGTLMDWIVGNALLPDVDNSSHDFALQKVDRTTVSDLREISSSLDSIQSEVDKADTGVNPLGLAKNVMPFDIDSSQISETGGKTHFEQIYNRAVSTLNNAITVFNYANNVSQQLRRQADDSTEFTKAANDRVADFKNRLIEIFGTPYADDIGNGGQTYAAGYDGPDIQHYDYVDPSALLGIPPGRSETFRANFKDAYVDDTGAVSLAPLTVTYNLSRDGFGFVKPPSWTGQRKASGEIQMARSDLLQARFRFVQALGSYNNLIAQIQTEAATLEAQFSLHADEITILTTDLSKQKSLDSQILNATEAELNWRRAARIVDEVAAGVAEMLPQDLIVGLSDGGDMTSVARGAIRLAGSAVSETLQYEADQEQLTTISDQQAKTELEAQSNIDLTTKRNNFDNVSALGRLRELVRQEVPQRVEIQGLQEAMQQSIARYRSALARGFRLLEDYRRFQRETAAKVQTERYKDMAFRIFRNDALQKYQAQFDLAASYVYMAARAFDYETNFDPSDPRSPRALMSQIIRSRAIGLIQDGQPQTGGATGDPGLADAMARMINNWAVLQGQFGFNNPQREEMQFSLRREFFRIPAAGATNDALWRTTLERLIVPNLYDLPEFKRFARFISSQTVEPGLVIPFNSTIDLGLNYFGRPLGGGDHAYDASHFATKIRSSGIWFNNYNNLALSDTPRVFLIPIGSDVMRSPVGGGSGSREWKIEEQTIPVPFPLGNGVPSDAGWIPMNDTLSGSFIDIRQYAPFRAYHDAGYNKSQVTYDSRLIGRSVWNTQWWLVIPAGYLSNDRTEALQRFINGALVNGVRDGNGIKDILMLFQTYSYQGQ